MDDIVLNYVNTMNLALIAVANDDENATKYTPIAGKLHRMRVEILRRKDYRDIIENILSLTVGNQYALLRCDIAGALYLIDKEMSKKIYQMHPDEPLAKHALKKFFGEETKTENKKSFFGKLFGG